MQWLKTIVLWAFRVENLLWETFTIGLILLGAGDRVGSRVVKLVGCGFLAPLAAVLVLALFSRIRGRQRGERW